MVEKSEVVPRALPKGAFCKKSPLKTFKNFIQTAL